MARYLVRLSDGADFLYSPQLAAQKEDDGTPKFREVSYDELMEVRKTIHERKFRQRQKIVERESYASELELQAKREREKAASMEKQGPSLDDLPLPPEPSEDGPDIPDDHEIESLKPPAPEKPDLHSMRKADLVAFASETFGYVMPVIKRKSEMVDEIETLWKERYGR